MRSYLRHIGPDTAYYRHANPKSWGWDTNTEFLSAILYILEWANWQRGGGGNDKPRLIRRPDSSPADAKMARQDLEERRRAHADELERRRLARQKGKRRSTIRREKEADVG